MTQTSRGARKPLWLHGKNLLVAKTKQLMYVLEAMNGPLDGKRWEFASRITIGRDAATAQAALPVDRAVSRRHAQIDANDAMLSILDLGSSNGTIVRGEVIRGPVSITLNEPFLIGRTMLRVLPADRVDVGDRHEVP